jgi:hypothetical protein
MSLSQSQGKNKTKFHFELPKGPRKLLDLGENNDKTWAEAGIFYLRKTKDNSENLDC